MTYANNNPRNQRNSYIQKTIHVHILDTYIYIKYSFSKHNYDKPRRSMSHVNKLFTYDQCTQNLQLIITESAQHNNKNS